MFYDSSGGYKKSSRSKLEEFNGRCGNEQARITGLFNGSTRLDKQKREDRKNSKVSSKQQGANLC